MNKLSKYIIACIGAVLVLSIEICIGVLKTDILFEVTSVETDVSANRYIPGTRVSTTITQIVEDVDDDGGNLPGTDPTIVPIPGLPSNPKIPQINVDTDSWYIDMPVMDATSSCSDLGFGLSIYDGPPWAVTGGSYIFRANKAKYDVYSWMSDLGVTGNPITSDVPMSVGVVSSKQSSMVSKRGFSFNSYGTPVKVVDGITCAAFIPMPTVVDRTYAADKAWTTAALDQSYYGYDGSVKLAAVVVYNPADINDSTKWKYIPLSSIDAKAHTYPWGVVQTNIRVEDEHTVRVSRDWDDQKDYQRYYKSYTKSIGDPEVMRDILVNVVLKDECKKLKPFTPYSWYNHTFETYSMPSELQKIINNLYLVGYMKWG